MSSKCNSASRAKQRCLNTTCVLNGNCTCRPPTSYYAGPLKTLQDFNCGNCDAPITVETWIGEPGVSGSTGISAVGLELCDKLIFWTDGTMDLHATSGSARVQIDAANLLCGDSGPVNPPPAPNRNFLYTDPINSSLYSWCGVTGTTGSWVLVSGGTGAGYDFWRDAAWALPNGINDENKFAQRNADIGVGMSGTLYIGDRRSLGSVVAGINAGVTGLGIFSVAIGNQAGETAQGAFSVAIGDQAGLTGQGGNSVAVGFFAGQHGQKGGSVAVGSNAAEVSQQIDAVAVGDFSGQTSQSFQSVAVGYSAGRTSQGATGLGVTGSAVAIGPQAGENFQRAYGVSVGYLAGNSNQSTGAVAVGAGAGQTNQDASSVALGFAAGNTNQGASSIAIGLNAGFTNLGANSICIGTSTDSTGVTGSIALGAGATVVSDPIGMTGLTGPKLVIRLGGSTTTQLQTQLQTTTTTGTQNVTHYLPVQIGTLTLYIMMTINPV